MDDDFAKAYGNFLQMELDRQARQSIRTLMLAIAVAILAILRLRERRG